MKLNREEQAIWAGERGVVVQQALQHQIKVGDFFGAEDFVPVTQAHIMADTESLGEAGVQWLERLAAAANEQQRVRIPTITDPRGTDFAKAAFLGQTAAMLDLEQRAIAAFVRLGVTMTDTCINYQTIQAPTRNEHVAFGDTGVVIYSNSICGARSNFEGGPSALAAGLTGRTPRCGFHRPELRRATLHIGIHFPPASLNEWGALGAVIGRIAGNYWAVPVIEGIEAVPSSDQLKHFGAAMASFGSVALFHLVGLTPEAARLSDVAPAGLREDEAFDAEIRARFQGIYDDAAAGRLGSWENTQDGALAVVIILDQFPRNMFRGSARAYATDSMARAVAGRAIARGFDQRIAMPARVFLYLPFEHSENPVHQEYCLTLLQATGDADLVEWGELHADIIRRFGRFPHAMPYSGE